MWPCSISSCDLTHSPFLIASLCGCGHGCCGYSLPHRAALDRAAVLLSMKREMVRLDNVWGVGGGLRPVKHLVKEVRGSLCQVGGTWRPARQSSHACVVSLCDLAKHSSYTSNLPFRMFSLHAWNVMCCWKWQQHITSQWLQNITVSHLMRIKYG